jgi:hypothetical protein
LFTIFKIKPWIIIAECHKEDFFANDIYNSDLISRVIPQI